MNRQPRDYSDLEFRTFETRAMTDADRALAHALFRENYRQANAAYLDKSFPGFKHISIATRGPEPAGFALGETRYLDLPRLPAQMVAMAGICCVGAAFRRRGLFVELERRAIAEGQAAPTGRWISAGRVAHPASFRLMTHLPSAVPRAGVTPSEWQRAVGQAIADAYGVRDFDPATFVCKGAGVPIGYPVLDVDVTPEEWRVFEPVDRDRGDSLLGIAWHPDAPEGW